MPRLMLFAACERVAYDTHDAAPNLLGVFQGFTVAIGPLPKAEAVSPDLVQGSSNIQPQLPIRWVAFALWKKASGDGVKRFSQVTELLTPDGKSFVRHTIEFPMEKMFHRTTINIVGFPIAEQGECILRLSLGEVGHEPKHIADYAVQVTHTEWKLDEKT